MDPDTPPAAPAEMPARIAPRPRPVWLLLPAGLAIIFGWPALDGQFLDGDDLGLIRDHVLVNHPSWENAGRLLGMVHGDLYQPLPMLTFMANYAVGGNEPLGYHAVNIAMHAVNAMLVALLAARLAGCPRVGILTAALFACHPFAMQPVAWITGRILLLATMFALIVLTALAYRRTSPPGPPFIRAGNVEGGGNLVGDAGAPFPPLVRGGQGGFDTRATLRQASGVWSIGVLLAWTCSLVCKVLPSVPVAALVCDLSIHRRRSPRFWVTFAAMLVLTAALSGAAYYTTQRLEYFTLMQAEMTTSFPARVVLATRYYFENYVWPTRLCAWSPPPVNVPFLGTQVAIGLAEWAVFAAVLAVSWKRCRPAAIGLVLFVVLLLPFLAAMKARTFLASDRYMYLPIVGLHLATAAWAVRAFDVVHSRCRAPVAGAVGFAAIAGVLVFHLWQGRIVAAAFHDDLSQAQRAVAMYPDDARAWVEMAHTLVKIGRPEDALAVIAEERDRWPDEPRFAAEAGEAYWNLRRYSLAADELTRALAGRPLDHRAKYYLGLSLASLGQTDRARELWREVVAQKDRFLPAMTALARSYRDAGQIDDAVAWFRRGLDLNPHHRDSLSELALIYMLREDHAAAAPLLDAILQLNPADEQARLNKAVCLARLGRSIESLALYDDLLRDAAGAPDAAARRAIRFNRAELLAHLGRTGDAEVEYREILRAAPADRQAAIGLHELLQSARRAAELPALWQYVASRPAAPEDAAAWHAFALTLAGRAQEVVAASRASTPDGAGAILRAWTDVWIALTAQPLVRGDMQSAVRRAVAIPVASTRDHEQIRAVVSALNDLARARADDPAPCFALYFALRAQGRSDVAQAVAERMTQVDPRREWPLH